VSHLSTEGKAEKQGTREEKQQKRSLKRYLLEKMEAWISGLLEAERDEFWGRGRYEALSGKEGNYRNGYRPRGINFFGLGRIELRVSRDRRGEFSSAWLPDGKGQDPELEAFLAETFLAGCSTRDLARITERHLGQKYDSKQIARIAARASQALETWRL
jgi:putative transposase